MGKVRHVTLGDEQEEKEQKKQAQARREAKKAKKAKDTSDESSSSDSASHATTTESVDQQSDTQSKNQKPKAEPKVKSKRYQVVAKLVDDKKLYPLSEAVALVKKVSLTSFDGTVELHINLNVNALSGKTEYRGSVNLPHGTGRQIRVLIATDEIIAQLEKNVIEFDILVAHPSMMPKLAKYARMLGPKGLMPNPKNGTVSPDPEKRAQELSGGEVSFKTEPNNPILHMAVGKVSFEDTKLIENIQTLFLTIGKNKIAKATLSPTMGPGIKIDGEKV